MEIGTVRPIRIEDELRNSYLDYAMSVIVSRSLPDVRDGLKPVHRRILYAMNELGLRYNTPYKKSARIVGEVLGKYHPHGDAPVYEALVRMAQDFSMRAPLVMGQGNFGSIDNDPPAAMRYTEARLAEISQEMLADIDKDTVDFTPNFDDSLKEPTILPARIPNLLLNGSSGIAVGMTTNIPPHNLGEVCDAAIHLVGSPDATVEDLMQYIQGPDFPTGGVMLGGERMSLRESLQKAYLTGQGKIVIQAKWHIEERGRDQESIIITELPYQANKAEVIERISKLMKEKRVEGIEEVRDESDREGIRVVIELRRDAQPERVLNNLYKHTSIRTAFFLNMLALVDGQPRVLNLKELLQHFIDFRRQVVTRRSRYELEQARARAHILEGLKIALDQIDLVITIIRGAANAEGAREELMRRLALSQLQAQAILDMQLRRLVSLERQKILNELEEMLKTIAYLEDVLANPEKRDAIIKEELSEVRAKYADDRRTTLSEESASELRDEDLIAHQPMVVTLSAARYIKRIPYETYRRQHRGGRGVSGMTIREADSVQTLLVSDTHDTLLFFTDKGKAYAIKCYQISLDASRTSRGISLANLLALEPKEQVAAVVNLAEFPDNHYLLLVTRLGRIKKVTLSAFASIRSNGLIAMSLPARDELLAARPAAPNDNVIMASEKGMAVKFAVSTLRSASRTAGGVRGLRLEEGDRVAGVDVALPGVNMLLVTANGYGKLTKADAYPLQSRGGKGRRAYRVNDKTGKVIGLSRSCDRVELMLLSEKGIINRMLLEAVPVQGRNTQGVILQRLDQGDSLVSFACL